MSGREICFFAMILPVFLNFHREEESYTRIYDYEFQFEKKKIFDELVKFVFPVENMFSRPLAWNIAPKFSIKHFFPPERRAGGRGRARFWLPEYACFLPRGSACFGRRAAAAHSSNILRSPPPFYSHLLTNPPHRNPESARSLARFDQWRISAEEASSPPRLERR
jgi:hypothetical protein